MNPRHDISDVLDKLFADQIERHAWLIRAGEQIRETNKTERAKEANDER